MLLSPLKPDVGIKSTIILLCFALQVSASSWAWSNEFETDYSEEENNIKDSEEIFRSNHLVTLPTLPPKNVRSVLHPVFPISQRKSVAAPTFLPRTVNVPGPGSKPDTVDGVFISSPPLPGSGKVFLFPSNENERKGDFFHTQGYCRKHGEEMVSIHSLEENTFLHSWIKRLGKIHPGIWLGSTIVNESTTIIWENGLPTDFVYWSSTDPNEGAFSCLLTGWEETALWWDYSCLDKRFNIVCQKRNNVAYPVPTTVPTDILVNDAVVAMMVKDNDQSNMIVETIEFQSA